MIVLPSSAMLFEQAADGYWFEVVEQKRTVIEKGRAEMSTNRLMKPIIDDIDSETAFLAVEDLWRKELLAHAPMQPFALPEPNF